MIQKNIGGIEYWKVKNFNFSETIIEIFVYGFLTASSEEPIKLLVVESPTSTLDNSTNYIQTLENYLINNVSEFSGGLLT